MGLISYRGGIDVTLLHDDARETVIQPRIDIRGF